MWRYVFHRLWQERTCYGMLSKYSRQIKGQGRCEPNFVSQKRTCRRQGSYSRIQTNVRNAWWESAARMDTVLHFLKVGRQPTGRGELVLKQLSWWANTSILSLNNSNARGMSILGLVNYGVQEEIQYPGVPKVFYNKAYAATTRSTSRRLG